MKEFNKFGREMLSSILVVTAGLTASPAVAQQVDTPDDATVISAAVTAGTLGIGPEGWRF